MSRTLIYLIAVFALWMYFSFGKFEKAENNAPTDNTIVNKEYYYDYENGHAGCLYSRSLGGYLNHSSSCKAENKSTIKIQGGVRA